MKEIIIVFIGGGLGSIFRYFFSKYFNYETLAMPYGTLFSNVLACFLFGFFSGYLYSKLQLEPSTKLFILTGICGGLSTFSTFNYEMFYMCKNGQFILAAIYFITSFVLCMGSFIVFAKN